MQDLENQALELSQDIDAAAERMRISELEARRVELQTASEQPDFWGDNERAQATMKEISKLETRVTPWLELQWESADVRELIGLGDESLTADLQRQLDDLQTAYSKLKEELKLAGP